MSDYQNNQPTEENSLKTPLAPDEIPDAEALISGEQESVSQKKESIASFLYDFLEIIVFSIAAALLMFTLFFRVCRVDGNSMKNTLHHGETLITSNLAKIEAGDIIVFHQTSDVYERFNEAIVKRVIATEGQTVRIEYATGNVYVDDVLLEESYVALLNSMGQEIGYWNQAPSMPGFNYETGVFSTTVPEGCYFVMGDNRNNSADSRSVQVGFVDTRRVLGKAVFRLKPWTVFD